VNETSRLQVGFIPLTDAATLLLAVHKGFAADEGLDVTLVREVSWSNVRDKLNVGLFDAAILPASVAIASSLGVGHIRVPIVAPLVLGLDGNAITVSPELHGRIVAEAKGEALGPRTTAQALARIAALRRAAGQEPLTFGITFPFSTHNYLLRYWVAAAGLDPDEDVRLVVLPPPLMVDSLANGHVDGFCVAAPWNFVAIKRNVGRILHFSTEILAHCTEKVLAARESWAARNGPSLNALVRALRRAAAFIEMPGNRSELAAILSHPDRIGVDPALIEQTLYGRLRALEDGSVVTDLNHLVAERSATRPDPLQAAWLYAQMVRWGQVALSADKVAQAMGVFRHDLFDAAVPEGERRISKARAILAFDGSVFDAGDIAAYLRQFAVRRR
jgi:ABC-type nitrate/sulfonate/bicarbonate transport system substrate-binding protein